MKNNCITIGLILLLCINEIVSKYTATTEGQNIILSPKNGHEKTLIWLHGLGDSAEGFYGLFDSEEDIAPEKTKVILLTAPLRPVTINGGFMMTSWYDIKNLDKSTLKEEDLYSIKEVKESYEIVKTHLDNEVKILGNSKNVFIGGFSQGCAMSLYTGLSYDKILGGIIGLSGYFFKFIDISNLDKPRYDMPIFLSHGEIDDVVPFLLAQQSYQRVLSNFKNASFQKEAFLPHSLSPNQLVEIRKWFKNLPQ